MSYYSATDLLSYNAMINLIMSNRGTGKTTDITRYGIKRFLEHGYKILYVKRYKEDLLATAPEFLSSEYLEKKFPDHKFSYKKGHFWCDGEDMGFTLSLNKTSRNKGITGLEKVGTIIFDEFITEDEDYITKPGHPFKEVENLMSIIDTANRGFGRTSRDELKVFLLANSVSVVNPYFGFFELDSVFDPDRRFTKTPRCLLEFFYDEEIAKKRQEGAFGQVVQGTAYGDYAMNNKFLLDKDSLLAEAPQHCWYLATFKYADKFYGVYEDKRKMVYYISEKYDPYCKLVYALSTDDHNEETFLLTRSQDLYKNLLANFDIGNVRFSSQRCKNILITFLNRAI